MSSPQQISVKISLQKYPWARSLVKTSPTNKMVQWWQSLVQGLVMVCWLCFPSVIVADELKVVQIYSQDELLTLIKHNQHLQRIRQDNCQLVQDIEARAIKVKIPAYQFLYGDMLAYGVCISKDVERGIYYMRQAADQALPEGLEQLGRYYHQGHLVQADIEQAITYLREAAGLGNLAAKIRLVEIFLQGDGSPFDYETAYRWLHQSVILDKKTHQKVTQLKSELAKLMPASVVARAKLPMASMSVN